jgi:hypothetical protein
MTTSDAALQVTPPPPRSVRLRLHLRALRWLLVFAAVLPPSCLLGLGSYENARLAELARDGRSIGGTIAAKRVRQTRSSEYMLEGAFEHEGQSYLVSQTVSRQRYEETPVGAAVEITFLPSDPSTAVLDRVDAARLERQRGSTSAAAATLFLAFACVVATFEVYLRRALRLLREGRAALGTIEPGRILCYRFADADGLEHRGRSRFRQAPPPELVPGAPAVVLYDPARPERSALLASLTQIAELTAVTNANTTRGMDR